MKWLRRCAFAVLVAMALAIPAYWWLLVESHAADPAGHAIDIAEVRRLAGSGGPQQIRCEIVAHLSAPAAFVVAGDGWNATDLPVSAFELVYPERVAIIDTGFDPAIAKGMGATRFDAAAYARIGAALAGADPIVVTHEHSDHVGGLLAQPALPRLLAATRLTREQVAVLDANRGDASFAVLHLPATLFRSYRPIDYARYLAIAPGVVLIKAPGHTPGSQMVYVRRADGAEFLFTGDVAWQMRNIETLHEKSRWVTWLADEDRPEVREELAALHRLHVAQPAIHMIPGHDDAAIAGLENAGLLVQGF